jgi:5-methyltetrahydrofolate--homocysteine methyltransferase
MRREAPHTHKKNFISTRKIMANINFTPEDWARVQRDAIAWWNGELERPLVSLSVTHPVPGCEYPRGYQSNYPLDLPAEAVVDRYEPWLASTRYYADAFPYLWMNFGPGIAAGFLGAQVNSVVDPSETVWFNPPRKIAASELHFTYDPENIWLKRVKDIIRAFVDRYGSSLQLGQTDLGGNLDIIASFLTTEQLLFDVAEQPEEIDRLVKEITALWIRYYAELDALIRRDGGCPGTSCWTPLWSPGKTYMLQCDFSYMISPKMFRRFVVPDIADCCDFLDHGFYHLDGKGEIPHLDLLLDIPRLRGIQWISGDGQPTPDQWLPLLKRIRDGGKLCQVFVDPEGALRIVRNLGGKGFLLVVNSYRPEFLNPEEVQGFLKTLSDEDISR